MQILENERKTSLAAVPMRMRLTHGACRRIKKERTIVSFAIVITGGTKTQWRPEDQNCRRQRPPLRFDQRRIKRRKVGTKFVEVVLEGSPSRVNREGPQHHHHRDRKSTRLNSSHMSKPYAVF